MLKILFVAVILDTSACYVFLVCRIISSCNDALFYRIRPDLTVVYDFTNLDQLIFEMWKNNLYIGFELMGNPSNFFTNFENSTQVNMWKYLVEILAKHYIGIYGIEYVRKWNFETWNEPDHHDFDNLNFTIQGFLNYYDACAEGLKQVDKSLKFGGPGGSCRVPGKGHSPICWALLSHCIKGRNFFTGNIGSHLDFISFHKKGNASTLLILDEEWETIQYIRNKIEVPKTIPFYNDEADPLKNWALPQKWRSDVTYAAMVVKMVLSHIKLYYQKNRTKDVHFRLLSNDNAFLSYFPHQFHQRTLLARFQVNNTYPNHVDFVRKPVFTIFGLLSQLCRKMLHAEIYHEGKEVKNMSEFGIVATSCFPKREQIVLIIYNSADTIASNVTFDIDISLDLTELTNKTIEARWVIFGVNNRETNPFLIWKKIGMPVYPTDEQFRLIKDKEEPSVEGPWIIRNVSLPKLNLQVLNPGVAMVNICLNQPGLKKVKNVRFLKIRNNSLLISWTDKHNRCVLTYNVEYSEKVTGPYIQLNKKNLVFPSYWHFCRINDYNCSVRGFYRISAIDYWFVPGPFSVPTKYSD